VILGCKFFWGGWKRNFKILQLLQVFVFLFQGDFFIFLQLYQKIAWLCKKKYKELWGLIFCNYCKNAKALFNFSFFHEIFNPIKYDIFHNVISNFVSSVVKVWECLSIVATAEPSTPTLNSLRTMRYMVFVVLGGP
jgi:hypothetical protein